MESEDEARSLNKLLRRLVVGMAVLLVLMMLAILALILKNTNKSISPVRLGNREFKAFIGKKCDRGQTILMRRSGDLRPACLLRPRVHFPKRTPGQVSRRLRLRSLKNRHPSKTGTRGGNNAIDCLLAILVAILMPLEISGQFL